MRVEVLNGVERRRRWPAGEKMRIVAESLEPGVTVTDIARRNDVAPSVLFAWRRQVRVPDTGPPALVPVLVAKAETTPPPIKARTRGPAKGRGLIEIDLGGGRRVHVDARVDARALGLVLDVLSRW